jgi:hypothetical protein
VLEFRHGNTRRSNIGRIFLSNSSSVEMDGLANESPRLSKKVIADEDCTILNIAQQTPE